MIISLGDLHRAISQVRRPTRTGQQHILRFHGDNKLTLVAVHYGKNSYMWGLNLRQFQ